MADTQNEALDDDAGGLDERRLARIAGFALPLATVLGFTVVTAVFGLAPGLLVLIGGTLIGVIALLWASLRVLSGDAPLPPEIEALDAGAHEVDQLAVRKTMLLRALKDLDNEKAIGKLDAEDHDAIASTYRAELKDVLRKMDEQLAPFRKDAERLASAYLERKGLLGEGPKEPVPAPEGEASAPRREAVEEKQEESARATCPACSASNEPDARFCKACGAAMSTKTKERTDEA